MGSRVVYVFYYIFGTSSGMRASEKSEHEYTIKERLPWDSFSYIFLFGWFQEHPSIYYQSMCQLLKNKVVYLGNTFTDP